MPGAETTALPSGYGLYLFQTLLALGAVCLLAYVVLRYGLKRLYGQGRGGQLLRVVERLPLDPRRSLFLVEVSGRRLLLGTGDQGVTFLTEVDPKKDELPEESEDESGGEGDEVKKTSQGQSQPPG